MMARKAFLVLQFCILNSAFLISQSCNCDESKIAFSQSYIESHQLIFRGKTISVGSGTDYAKAVFSVTQLFKGNAPKEVTVYFDMKSACSLKMYAAEDWLIYANYKQLQKPYVEYCSRSRKNVINTNKNVDLQYVKSDLTVDAESELLLEKLGLQRFAAQAGQDTRHSNIIPGFWQRVILILASIAGFIVIYLGVNYFLKK
jgi:hypothetical protein